MRFTPLTSPQELDTIVAASATRPQVLFKHSTRCNISSMVLARLEQGADKLLATAEVHYLDLIRHRDISNAIAERFAVHHESPQALIIQQGECTLALSHLEVDVKTIADFILQPA
jgi:bacillithiol system protein YtxJ